MPYADPADKRAWERDHRPDRSAAFLGIAHIERRLKRAREADARKVAVAERMADPTTRDAARQGEEAALGLGNPSQDRMIMRAIGHRPTH